MVKKYKKRAWFFIAIIVFTVGVVVPELKADNVDNLDLLPAEQLQGFIQPSNIYVSATGRAAVWDPELQKLQFFATENGREEDQHFALSTEDFLDEYKRARKMLLWDGVQELKGFWDEQDRFWYYDRFAAGAQQDFTVKEAFPADNEVVVDGSVTSIVPVGSHWIVQGEDGVFSRWDPDSQRGIVDTFTIEVEGELLAISEDNRYFSRRDEEIFVYEDSKLIRRRKFDGLVAVDYQDGFLFILRDEGSISRVNLQLSLEFTFDLLTVPELSDFAVLGEYAYLTGLDGIYYLKLDETGRSFFSSSVTLRLNRLAGAEKDFFNHDARPQRLWIDADGFILRKDRHLQKIGITDTGLQKGESQLQETEVPLVVFQFFQSDNTFWDGERLYYYFPGEEAIEAYDREGHTVEQVNIDINNNYDIQNINFLGANDELILMKGQIVFPGEGYRTVVISFDWTGNLKRMVRLQHPAADKQLPDDKPYPLFRFDGVESIYAIYSDYIQQYDLSGYPGQLLGDVIYPRDIIRHGDELYILDRGGWRVSRRSVPPEKHVRFFTPPHDLTVLDAVAVDDQKIIFTGYSDSEKAIIYEYEPSTGQYRRALQHPVRELRFPFIVDPGDRFFFWGREGAGRFTLYNADLQRYDASSTGFRAEVRGPGLYVEDRELVLVPVQEQDGLRKHYRYWQEDETGKLQNSEGLLLIVEGGFAGYYAVKESKEGNEIVSGYFERIDDTGPFQWQQVESVAAVNSRVDQLLSINGKLYLSLKKDGYSQLATLEVAANDTEVKDIVFSAYGELRWVQPGDNSSLILQREENNWGRLLQLYGASPASGGLSGSVVTDEPVDIDGIELLVQPGGQIIETGRHGSFSAGGINNGYVQIFPVTYEYHFHRPYNEFIPEDEFRVDRRVSLYPTESPFLLERGRDNFQEGDLRRARIALEAFRRLASEGPYYDWSGALLKDIYRRQEDFEMLWEIYAESSAYFTGREKYNLWQNLKNSDIEKIMLQDFAALLSGLEKQMAEYYLVLMTGRVAPEPDLIIPPPPVFINSFLPMMENNN